MSTLYRARNKPESAKSHGYAHTINLPEGGLSAVIKMLAEPHGANATIATRRPAQKPEAFGLVFCKIQITTL